MAKIPLTIDPGYCMDWGAWEGVRELVSNAKDAEDEDPARRMEIQHLPRTSRLVIRTEKTVVDPSALLVLGKSNKRGSDVRGRFGEGFAIGMLALTRAGHEVTFKNDDESWRCSLERADEDHPFAGNELLTFYSRKVTPTQDFEVTIEGITAEIWDAMKKLFLFLTPPPAEYVVRMKEGTLLTGADQQGKVFARGVFVRHFEDLRCGYDLKNLELDRDRRMVDEWRLHDQLAELWKEAVKSHPDKLSRPLYDIVKSDSPESRHLRWHTDEKLLKTVRKEFETENGEDAVPVTTMAEAKEIMELGAKPKVVNNTLKELLEKSGVSANQTKQRLEGEISRRLDLTDLSREEIARLSTVQTITKDYVVVEFRSDKTLAKPIDENTLLGVDRRLLHRPFREILLHVVNAEAKKRGVSTTDVLLAAMQSVLRAPPTVIVDGDDERCDECGELIPSTEKSGVNRHHATSCSAYPSGDGTPGA